MAASEAICSRYPRLSMSTGRNARAATADPIRLTSMTRRQATGSDSTKGPPFATPALATTMSTSPNRSFAPGPRDLGNRLVVGDIGVPEAAFAVQAVRPA